MGDESDQEFQARAVACLDALYGFALSLCRDPDHAEDLAQETYVRAFRAERRPAPGDNLRAWLFTILHNVWRNERRHREPESFDGTPGLLRFLPATPPQAEREIDAADARERLRAAIGELPEPYREVVMLRFGEGFSYQEIAAVLGCPAGTVMSRLARARALLRQAVAPAGPAADRAPAGRTGGAS